MADRYATFANSGAGRAVVKRLGLPAPPRLRRYRPGAPLVPGPVLVDAAPGGRLHEPVREILKAAGIPDDGARYAALVFDASGITDSTGLRALYDFLHPNARSLTPCGRVIVLGTPPEACESPRQATAQRAIEGLTRSIGKEFGRGTTSQLVYVTPGAEGAVESTVRFLLSGRSAYVSGQVIRIAPASAIDLPVDWEQPLDGKVALVTGAARGIGAAIARILARDGAQVIGLDVPAAGDALAAVVNEIRGTAVQLDLTAAGAPDRLADHMGGRHGRVDIVVHNAGITRDKTIARMDADRWDSVLDVNLSSQERINEVLLDRDLIPVGGRLIGVASIAGIAGNRGQTNYATSKAGVIGLVQSMAPVLAERGITINAVAPGFIETRMTAKVPVMIREAGRRMNSMAQGGLPVDVAETIAWFASPASGGITGNVVRVCGQSLLGA
ncbi:3-oxoacyl-ACP reductase [Phytohabitans flavus]|uniref:3-oxoacyl-ACP reductase n=1 Tax=Phytohabitans flavus TaxID=1076124 RepID=A0A6F8Y3Y1_9ACTN|nr:3-oxoacyl-ACP reductase [Phytohabitans flavus]BCB80739.1 3-oxoacyl-ACP reductase [Phytohabitans flavus]